MRPDGTAPQAGLDPKRAVFGSAGFTREALEAGNVSWRSVRPARSVSRTYEKRTSVRVIVDLCPHSGRLRSCCSARTLSARSASTRRSGSRRCSGHQLGVHPSMLTSRLTGTALAWPRDLDSRGPRPGPRDPRSESCRDPLDGRHTLRVLAALSAWCQSRQGARTLTRSPPHRMGRGSRRPPDSRGAGHRAGRGLSESLLDGIDQRVLVRRRGFMAEACARCRRL
jgi:hypothetical protein